jgi:carbonic anhydrase
MSQSPQTLVDYNKSFEVQKVCSGGKLQSPINLNENDAILDSQINFLSDDFKTITGQVTLDNDGSVYTMSAPAGTDFGTVYLTKKGYLTKNLLKRISINFPSEHEINGISADLEVKLIHERVIGFKSPVNQNRPLEDANMIFTISILFKRGTQFDSDQGFLDGLFNGWKSNPANTPFFQSGFLNLSMNNMGLIRGKPFFSYEGSNTVTPCDENVNYIVISQIIRMDDAIFSFLDTQFRLRYTNGKSNKAISLINGRPVYRNYAILSDNLLNSNGLKFCLIMIGMILIAIL